MLKIRSKHMNILDFVSTSLFCLEKDKLSWNLYWHKNSSYKYIHMSALQSRKLMLREPIRLMFSFVLVFGLHKFKCPPLTAFKNILLRTFQSNRIFTMSIYSQVILNGYKFTDEDVLKEVIIHFKNTTNISRTSFNRDK